MKRLIAYPLTVIYYFFFGITLVSFHAIQWVCLKLGGYQWHKKSVDYFNYFLMRCLNLIGVTFSFDNQYDIPEGVPLIIISNHQSMYDISPISWFLRKHHPKFISKIELGKGIPSISFNLRHGGSVLIDRKNTRQSLPALKKFAQYIEQNNHAAVIFPEGTRSKDGQLKRFSENGLKILLKNAPSAVLLPITINNSWKILKFGSFPLNPGVRLTVTVHQPLPVRDIPFETLFEKTRDTIAKGLIN